MPVAGVYDIENNRVSEIDLSDAVFGAEVNEAVLHDVVRMQMAGKRCGTASTKRRQEIRGGGKKPWRQKGTGRARHGSRRSPIWVGGGVAHGPRNDRDYSTKINKKMKVKALFTVLSRKFKDGEVVFLADLSLRTPKTKEAKNIITALSKVKEFGSIGRRNNAAFIALPEKDENTLKSFNNFGNLEVGQLKDLNVTDLLQYRYLVLAEPEKSVASLSAKLK